LVGRGLHGPVPQAKKMQHIQNISAVWQAIELKLSSEA
jgi:hypothetical protein